MSTILNSPNVPEKSILDINGRQTYLGNQFLASANSTSIATTAETPFVMITNPSTSTKSIFQNFRRMTCLTATQTAIFRIYFNPTVVSPGTPVTPLNLRSSSTAVSSSVITTAPTLSNFGSYVSMLASNAFSPNASSLLAILDPGSSVLVTVQVSANATNVASEFSWYEI